MPRRAKYINVKSLLEAVNETNGDPAIKQRAIDFLSTDLAKLRTESELREAWAGLFAVIQILGPLHAAYRQSLEVCRKALRDYSAETEAWRKVWEDMKPNLVDTWKQCCKIFQSYAPADVWEKAEPALNGIAGELEGSNKKD